MKHLPKFCAVACLAVLFGLTIRARGKALSAAYRIRVLLSEREVLENEGRAWEARLEKQRSPRVLLDNAQRAGVPAGRRLGDRQAVRPLRPEGGE